MVKICALGAASQDVFVSGKNITSHLDLVTHEYVETFRSGAKLEVDKVVFSTGGGATNAAVTFSRQGLDSSFIGRIGDDAAGQAVLRELDNDYVNTGQVITDQQKGTQYSTILLAENGERTILIYRGAAQDHRAYEYEKLDLAGYDWIYVSSFAGAFEALDVIFNKAKEFGVKIAFNPGDKELANPEKLRALLEDVEILIVNKDEAQLIIEGRSSEELARHALNYVDVALISDGPNGVVATDGKSVVIAGLYDNVPVIDRTGAGDAFGSGFLSYWAQGKPLKESVVFASANSTSVVAEIGAKAGILHKGTKLHDMPIDEKDF